MRPSWVPLKRKCPERSGLRLSSEFFVLQSNLMAAAHTLCLLTGISSLQCPHSSSRQRWHSDQNDRTEAGKRMMGMVFTELLEMIESSYSLDAVDAVLDRSKSDGVYTSVGYYPDSELVALVQALSEHTGRTIPDLLFAFGQHVFGRFLALYPVFFAHATTAPMFLQGLETRVHTEVRKLYENARPPLFLWEEVGPGRYQLEYRSERGLGAFAHGLLEGCLAHYGHQHVIVDQQDESGGKGTIVRFSLVKV
jgi:hypothetical protein